MDIDKQLEGIVESAADRELLKRVKGWVGTDKFDKILYEIIESEHAHDFRVVMSIVGELQEIGETEVWVKQAQDGDINSGTVCIEMGHNYLMWSYWM